MQTTSPSPDADFYELQLTCGNVAIVSLVDKPLIDSWRWAWRTNDRGYVVSDGERRVRLHRLIMGEPQGCLVDHKNRDKLDNRRGNLRVCSHSKNSMNRVAKTGGKSKYKGVDPVQQKNGVRFLAQINREGKGIRLGYFDNEDDAARAYDAAAIRLHGEFARLNFPPVGASSAFG